MRTFTKASFLLILSAAVLLAGVNGTVFLDIPDCATCAHKIAGTGGQTLLATAKWCVIPGFQACVDSAVAAGTTYPAGCTPLVPAVVAVPAQNILGKAEVPATNFASCAGVTGGKETQLLTLWGGPNGCGGCLKLGATKKWCAFADGLHTCVDSANASTDEIYKTCHKEAATVLFPSTTMTCPVDAKKDPLPVHPQHDCGICLEAAKKNNKLVWCMVGDFKGCVDKTQDAAKACKFYKNQKMACNADATDLSNTKSSTTVIPEMKTVLLKEIATCDACKTKINASSNPVAGAKWCAMPDFNACVDTAMTSDAGVHYPEGCKDTAVSNTCTTEKFTTGEQKYAKKDLTAWGCEMCMQKRADAMTGNWQWCVIMNGTVDVFQDCVDTSVETDELVKLCKTSGKGTLHTTCPATKSGTLPKLSEAKGDCGKCHAVMPVNDKLAWCVAGGFHGCVDKTVDAVKSCMYKKHQVTCPTAATDLKNTMKGVLADIPALHTDTKDCGTCMTEMKTKTDMVWCVTPTMRKCVDKGATTTSADCKKPENHHDCGDLTTNTNLAPAVAPTTPAPTTTATTAAPASSFTAGLSAISIAAAFGAQLLI